MILEEWRPGVAPGELTVEGRALAQRLTKERRLLVDELRKGVRVRATSFVGQVRLGALTVTIQPKLRGAPLQRLLRYAYGLRDLETYGAVEQGTAEDGLIDLLLQQLYCETEELLARGLHRTYVRREEALASPRGRIDFQRYLAGGEASAAALPCQFHQREVDGLQNQVLLAGLHLAAALTDDAGLRQRALQLAARLGEGVTRVRLASGGLERALNGLDRRTEKYGAALRIVALLHEGQGLSESHGEARLPGFLFDMNRFFQELLGRFLGEYVPTGLPGARVVQEHRLVGMLRYAANHNPKRRAAPTPRPDFAVFVGRRRAVLLDAKYRDLWERPLPREMLYQLAMYALSQGDGGHAVILYATMRAEAKEARVEVYDPVDERVRGEVVLRPVHLMALDELLKRDASDGKRAAFAIRLAFGTPAQIGR